MLHASHDGTRSFPQGTRAINMPNPTAARAKIPRNGCRMNSVKISYRELYNVASSCGNCLQGIMEALEVKYPKLAIHEQARGALKRFLQKSFLSAIRHKWARARYTTQNFERHHGHWLDHKFWEPPRDPEPARNRSRGRSEDQVAPQPSTSTGSVPPEAQAIPPKATDRVVRQSRRVVVLQQPAPQSKMSRYLGQSEALDGSEPGGSEVPRASEALPIPQVATDAKPTVSGRSARATGSRGRPKKDFVELSERQRRRRVTEVRQALDPQLITAAATVPCFTPAEALAIMLDTDLSKHQYETLRLAILEKCKIEILPSYTRAREEKQT